MNHGGPNSFLNVQIMAKESQGTITFEEEKSDFALGTQANEFCFFCSIAVASSQSCR